MKDLSNSVACSASLTPAVRTADTNGTGIDLQGFESATVVWEVGAEGDTLSSSVKIEAKLEHSDDDSTYTAVAQADVVDGTVSSGVFATYDADSEAPAVAKIGYIGGKRYIRVVDERTGTHSTGTPTSAVIVKGNPRHTSQV